MVIQRRARDTWHELIWLGRVLFVDAQMEGSAS
jgi:hypothetical protein